jgi:hypothetical protein
MTATGTKGALRSDKRKDLRFILEIPLQVIDSRLRGCFYLVVFQPERKYNA